MKLTTLLTRTLIAWVILSSQAVSAQTAPAPGSPNDPNLKLVKAWYTAFEKKDWNSMRHILADGFTFSSPLDDHIKIDSFKSRCWPNAYNIKKVDLEKLVFNGQSAFVISDGWTMKGKLFRNGDYFTFKDGKIKAYECFFGQGVNYPNSGK